ncbi:hypothetical protein U0070_015618, partial [Myodes glareolus]
MEAYPVGPAAFQVHYVTAVRNVIEVYVYKENSTTIAAVPLGDLCDPSPVLCTTDPHPQAHMLPKNVLPVSNSDQGKLFCARSEAFQRVGAAADTGEHSNENSKATLIPRVSDLLPRKLASAAVLQQFPQPCFKDDSFPLMLQLLWDHPRGICAQKCMEEWQLEIMQKKHLERDERQKKKGKESRTSKDTTTLTHCSEEQCFPQAPSTGKEDYQAINKLFETAPQSKPSSMENIDSSESWAQELAAACAVVQPGAFAIMEVKHGGGRTPGKHHSTNPAMLFATLDVSSVQIPDLEKDQGPDSKPPLTTEGDVDLVKHWHWRNSKPDFSDDNTLGDLYKPALRSHMEPPALSLSLLRTLAACNKPICMAYDEAEKSHSMICKIDNVKVTASWIRDINGQVILKSAHEKIIQFRWENMHAPDMKTNKPDTPEEIARWQRSEVLVNIINEKMAGLVREQSLNQAIMTEIRSLKLYPWLICPAAVINQNFHKSNFSHKTLFGGKRMKKLQGEEKSELQHYKQLTCNIEGKGLDDFKNAQRSCTVEIDANSLLNFTVSTENIVFMKGLKELISSFTLRTQLEDSIHQEERNTALHMYLGLQYTVTRLRDTTDGCDDVPLCPWCDDGIFNNKSFFKKHNRMRIKWASREVKFNVYGNMTMSQVSVLTASVLSAPSESVPNAARPEVGVLMRESKTELRGRDSSMWE